MDRRRPPNEGVWRPKFARRERRGSDMSVDEDPGLNENLPRLGRTQKRTPSEDSRNGRDHPKKRGSGRMNFDSRDHFPGSTSGMHSSTGSFDNLDMTGPQSVANGNQLPNATRNIIQSWVKNKPDEASGWKTAKNKRGLKKDGINRNPNGEQPPQLGYSRPESRSQSATRGMAEDQMNAGRSNRGRGGYSTVGRGGIRRGNLRSPVITQLNSLDDWTSLSAFDNPLRIMLKLQEFETSWIASFHSDASFEVMDIAFDLFLRIDAKYKFGRLVLMKNLFTAPFFERLKQFLEKLKSLWFSLGKDKIVGFVERIRKNLEFILSNDPAYHDNDTAKSQMASLGEDCISLLQHINLKLLDLQGSNDENIEKEILNIEELGKITFIEMAVLEEPIHPEDFRSTYDVMPNNVHGAYESDDHYVQTHFGLLKEDFQSTLREGVEQYLLEPKQRNFKIWAYENVVVKRYFHGKDKKKVLFQVTFPESTSYFTKIQWNYVKRFMFGSLVVLTADKFASYHLAMIEDRNFEKPSNISIVINFIYSPPIAVEETKFLLVEPKVFYEPYFHSMKVLKHMAKVGLPLKKYIVNADTSPALPKYLNSDTVYRIGTLDIKISSIISWPKAEDLGLNRSQREAFMNALTSEMTLIQGPPGTGKTFLAFKIISTLIKNRKSSYKDGPILIVCYKNHSLDQILEGLLNRGRKVVRIGSMSKVKALKYECNVKNLPAPPTISALRNEKHDLEEKLSTIMLAIQDVDSIIKLVKSRIGIIRLEMFKECGVVDPFINLPLDTWLMEKVTGAKQIPLDQIIGRCRHLSGLINCGSLQRVFGSEALDSLFVANLYDLGTDVIGLNEILVGDSPRNDEEYYKKWEINDQFWLKFEMYIYLNYGFKLAEESSADCPNPKSVNFPGYHRLEAEERWALYKKWEQEFIRLLEEKLVMLQNQVSEIEDNLLEYKEMELGQTLKYARPDVVGVTTSGASKHYSALADVGAKIVLVEEAAEVLEAHVIASLSTKCEHLILIGDHQQLKPTTASFVLGKQYRMDTSLFERMIVNEIKYSCLSTQHRMRPDIAALICPSIYSNLSNSPSVDQYPDVIGTKKNVFFFSHNHPEQVGYDSDSKFNPNEADMLLAICSYLIKQDYDPKDITILSTYLEQDRYIKKARDRKYSNSPVTQVNCTVVDNYQGEENIIILLSLVRSNDFGQVGFLSTKNRVCVALSRAKHGLFIFGNMPCLSKTEPTIWSDINDVLVQQGSIGTKFPLKCTKHNNITEVGSPEDVAALRNAGCRNPCDTPLPCGHTCHELCHGQDQSHQGQFACRQQCIRKCPNRHTCNAPCRAECPPCPVQIPKVLVCGHSVKLECHKPNVQNHCTQTVEIKLDACGHIQTVLCRMTMNRERIVCKAICLKEYTCGHICKRTCHINNDPDHKFTLCDESCELINKSCPRKHRCNRKCRDPCGDCLIPVQKTLECNHKAMVQCSLDVSGVKCREYCSRKLPCQHDCVNPCADKCGPCLVKVEKVIEACGHKLEVACSAQPSRSNCKERCQSNRSCGHPCSGLCKSICEEQFCDFMVEVDLSCGHKSSVKCGDATKNSEDIGSKCTTPCQALLPCGHSCEGTCGTCLQNRIHIPCRRKCEKTLVCSHKCRSQCNDTTHTCTIYKCLKKCWHNEANNKDFYKRGKGRNKQRTEFEPENKLIFDLRFALNRSCKMVGKYVRDLPHNKSLSSMIDSMQTFVHRTLQNSYTDKHKELSLLKTCLFKMEFITVFPAMLKRLLSSSLNPSKKLELDSLLAKLIFRVSSQKDDMGIFGMQQIMEQMVWVSLVIDAHDIAKGLKFGIGDVLHDALESTKLSFGPKERSSIFQLFTDFKLSTGINTPLRTAKWEDMFPNSRLWCAPVDHHRPILESQETEGAPVVADQERDGGAPVVADQGRNGDAPVVADQERNGDAPVVADQERDGGAPVVADQERNGDAPVVADQQRNGDAPVVADQERDGGAPVVADRERKYGVPVVADQEKVDNMVVEYVHQMPDGAEEEKSANPTLGITREKEDGSRRYEKSNGPKQIPPAENRKMSNQMPDLPREKENGSRRDDKSRDSKQIPPDENREMNDSSTDQMDDLDQMIDAQMAAFKSQKSQRNPDALKSALGKLLGLGASSANGTPQQGNTLRVDWNKSLQAVENLSLRSRASSIETLVDSDDGSSRSCFSRQDEIKNLRINDID